MIRRLILAAAIALSPVIAAAQGSAPASPLTARDLVQRLFGLVAPPNIVMSNPTVGTTPVRVLAFDADRFELLVINTSTATCDLLPSPTVSTTNGIVLGAGGGNTIVSVREDLLMPTLEWWAVCSAAGSALTVFSADTE